MTKQPPFRAWCYCGSDTCSDFIFSVLFLSSRGELSHVLHTSTRYCHVGPSWVPGQRQAVPSYLLSGTAPQRTGGSESGRCVVRTVSSGLWGRRGDTSVVSLEGDESPSQEVPPSTGLLHSPARRPVHGRGDKPGVLPWASLWTRVLGALGLCLMVLACPSRWTRLIACLLSRGFELGQYLGDQCPAAQGPDGGLHVAAVVFVCLFHIVKFISIFLQHFWIFHCNEKG